MSEMEKRIRKMNLMYDLTVNSKPTNLGDERLDDFFDVLDEEISEGCEIDCSSDEALVQMADWLGDIVVYCYSEAAKWGIPLDDVLGAIMDSNESKLGADGKPIHDSRGKALKGPNFVPPEPRIREILGVKP